MSRFQPISLQDESDSATELELLSETEQEAFGNPGRPAGVSVEVIGRTPDEKKARPDAEAGFASAAAASAPTPPPRHETPAPDDCLKKAIGALVSAEARQFSEHGESDGGGAGGNNAVRQIGSIVDASLGGQRKPVKVAVLSKRRPFAAQAMIAALEAIGWTHIDEGGGLLLPSMFDDSTRQAETVAHLTMAQSMLQYALVNLDFRLLAIQAARDQAEAERDRFENVQIVDVVEDDATVHVAAAAVGPVAGAAGAATGIDVNDGDGVDAAAAALRGAAMPSELAYTVKVVFPDGLRGPLVASGLKASEPLVALFALPGVRTGLGLDRRTNPLADFALAGDGQTFTEFKTNNYSLFEVFGDSRRVVVRIESRVSVDRGVQQGVGRYVSGSRGSMVVRLTEPRNNLSSPSVVIRDPWGDRGKKIADLIRKKTWNVCTNTPPTGMNAVIFERARLGGRGSKGKHRLGAFQQKLLYTLADNVLDMAVQEVSNAAGYSEIDRERAVRALNNRRQYSMSSAIIYGEGSKLHDHVDGHGTWVVLWTLHGNTQFNCGGTYVELRSGDALVSCRFPLPCPPPTSLTLPSPPGIQRRGWSQLHPRVPVVGIATHLAGRVADVAQGQEGVGPSSHDGRRPVWLPRVLGGWRRRRTRG